MEDIHFTKTVIPQIESLYSQFTVVERTIADFFIHNKKQLDFSSKNISSLLYVSEASLSRFAKRCGFKGYREFIFYYRNGFTDERQNIDDLSKSVLNTYQEILNKSFALVDEQQMHRIAKLLSKTRRVYVYGVGSSGIAAQEFKLRFMRLGMDVEAIADSHIMKINTALANEDYLIIGITVSGKSVEITSSLQVAKLHGAKTIIVTSNNHSSFRKYCDEVLLVAVKENLEEGKLISPQFPILIMVDIFFIYYLNTDFYKKSQMYSKTISVLNQT